MKPYKIGTVSGTTLYRVERFFESDSDKFIDLEINADDKATIYLPTFSKRVKLTIKNRKALLELLKPYGFTLESELTIDRNFKPYITYTTPNLNGEREAVIAILEQFI